MKVTLLTYGSRGDVQPFLALAARLQQAGHTPSLAAPQRFSSLIQSLGIKYFPLAGDPDELSRMFNESGSSLYGMVRDMWRHLSRIAPEVVRAPRNLGRLSAAKMAPATPSPSSNVTLQTHTRPKARRAKFITFLPFSQ